MVVALLWTVFLDLMTPAFDARTYRWDSAIYLDMAERGVRGNEGLVAPFAYRFVTPLLARRLARWLPLSIDDGFRIVTYTGIVAELVFVFALARLVAASTRAAFVVMAVAGLSLFNVRFLLFDPYRPDALAFPLALASICLVLSGRPGPAALLAAGGLLVREFLLAPLGAALDALVRRRGPVRQRLGSVALPVALAVVAVALPRVLIPVRQNVAVTDPFRADLVLDAPDGAALRPAGCQHRVLRRELFPSLARPRWKGTSAPRLDGFGRDAEDRGHHGGAHLCPHPLRGQRHRALRRLLRHRADDRAGCRPSPGRLRQSRSVSP